MTPRHQPRWASPAPESPLPEADIELAGLGGPATYPSRLMKRDKSDSMVPGRDSGARSGRYAIAASEPAAAGLASRTRTSWRRSGSYDDLPLGNVRFAGISRLREVWQGKFHACRRTGQLAGS